MKLIELREDLVPNTFVQQRLKMLNNLQLKQLYKQKQDEYKRTADESLVSSIHKIEVELARRGQKNINIPAMSIKLKGLLARFKKIASLVPHEKLIAFNSAINFITAQYVDRSSQKFATEALKEADNVKQFSEYKAVSELDTILALFKELAPSLSQEELIDFNLAVNSETVKYTNIHVYDNYGHRQKIVVNALKKVGVALPDAVCHLGRGSGADWNDKRTSWGEVKTMSYILRKKSPDTITISQALGQFDNIDEYKNHYTRVDFGVFENELLKFLVVIHNQEKLTSVITDKINQARIEHEKKSASGERTRGITRGVYFTIEDLVDNFNKTEYTIYSNDNDKLKAINAESYITHGRRRKNT